MQEDELRQIEDMASLILKRTNSPTREEIAEAVAKASEILTSVISAYDCELIAKRLEERFDIRMPLGTIFSSDTYRPWLDDARGDTNWYYWLRYKRYLEQKRFAPDVVRSLDSITDTILDHLENPNKLGEWRRKGMVVGHVQSGKTANYTGLIAKAADSGYRVIIILAGLLNSLRNQTQERIDYGFVGKDSAKILLNLELHQVLVGVGELDRDRMPVSLTTSNKDFDTASLTRIAVGLDALKEPLVLVLKKHTKTLDSVIKWLLGNNQHLENHPMLLIDDEADHASINTSNDPEQATAINRRIRKLVRIFDRSSYVGYTATPFANIFVDPQSDDEMLGDDLFPRDFILNLAPPTNYVGPSRIFADEADLDIVREISDFVDILPLKHPNGWERELKQLPNSLEKAIAVFVLVRAARLLRGQVNEHNSMMVNVSRFTKVQSAIALLVDEYVKKLRQAIIGNFALPEDDALQNSYMQDLFQLWRAEYATTGFPWSDFQRQLKAAVSPIAVVEVNSSQTATLLDYSREKYPNGRNVIAVGGLGLSRGLTLEGLTVSYFLRNSIMYDTLMQMGRWFGYRDGYADLCRIYMTPDAASWYSYIAGVMEELRSEFNRMKMLDLSPKDFGLAVRNHPDSLIVTARNKMRTGSKVLRQVSLDGRLIETAVLASNDTSIAKGFAALSKLVTDLGRIERPQESPLGYLWKRVSVLHIKNFLGQFENHPGSQLTETKPVEQYIDWMTENGIPSWDVVVLSPAKITEPPVRIEDLSIRPQWRKASLDGKTLTINKRRVASRGQERAGLTVEEIAKAKAVFSNTKSMPDYLYRSVRTQPLFMLHILDPRGSNDLPLSGNGIVAWGISFPGVAGSGRPEKLVEYTVNTTWWKEHYEDSIDDEADVYDE
jgi:hypothetical protein